MGRLGAVIDDARKWRAIDSALAVGAAVVVAYGVLVLQWSVFVVIALFWFENVVIGVLNVTKMLISGARIGGLALIGALALAAFFTVHYGMFTLAHGVFVVALFGKPELAEAPSGLFAPLGQMLDYLLADREGWIAAASIALLQTAAFFRWWSATREQPTPAMLPHLMFAPYGRIVVLHITVIISGLLVGMLKQPVLGALLLVALKLAFDLGALTTVIQKRPSRLLPIRRFIISQEEDARRP